MTVSVELYDITIIGGGPVGMFAAFYAGMRNAKTKIIESLPVLGGQVSLLYPEKTIYDVGGYAGVTGKELVHQLTAQMQHFDQTICLDQEVKSIEKLDHHLFKIETTKETHYSKTVILTTGQGSFQPRKLTLPLADRFEQTNLHYIVKDLEQYKDKTVVICGGGDTAVDWALTLEGIARKVFLVHRREHFRAHEGSVEMMKASNIDILTPMIPYKLIGDSDYLKAVEFKETRGDKLTTVDLDFFIINYGFVSSIGPIKDWDINLDQTDIIVNSKMETSIEGIYAAGDSNTFDGKIKLIATGFGEAPTAVNHAIHSIYPKEHAQPIQSTKLSFED
ncbi:NAD(P)/FAD-dependent oxidoreductase [Alkalibacterium olivapovliticus]|uniref:Ferredoxin--NADP reductase n=1 Tax=Alkalibacterium olivapovliticus TaxID=99907 RepID=A0A2T0W7Z2_9LACT|nr:NAD(P)/FAD-dependent oxidoreductase [Alkalibacterium olivapovliticus]PRY82802.1 thioredoxin reductase (NADPH) [Alkalibacterium olivapovliticus]